LSSGLCSCSIAWARPPVLSSFVILETGSHFLPRLVFTRILPFYTSHHRWHDRGGSPYASYWLGWVSTIYMHIYIIYVHMCLWKYWVQSIQNFSTGNVEYTYSIAVFILFFVEDINKIQSTTSNSVRAEVRRKSLSRALRWEGFPGNRAAAQHSLLHLRLQLCSLPSGSFKGKTFKLMKRRLKRVYVNFIPKHLCLHLFLCALCNKRCSWELKLGDNMGVVE
jgi:hypothetical protein